MNSISGQFSPMRKHVLYYTPSAEEVIRENSPSTEKEMVQTILTSIQTEQVKRSLTPDQVTAGEIRTWENIEVTDEELFAFQDALKPTGAFRQALEQGLATQETMHLAGQRPMLKQEVIDDLKIVCNGMHPQHLDKNHNPLTFKEIEKFKNEDWEDLGYEPTFLFAEEMQALALYSSDLYNLFNGFMSNNNALIKDSLKKMKMPIDNLEALKKEMKPIVTVLASALNKLPKHEGTIYRGAILQDKELKLLEKEGTYLSDSNFISCTTSQAVAKGFTKGGQGNKTIYLIGSENSRNIEAFSLFGEQERAYLPGQCFRSLGVEEGKNQFSGFHVVYLEEVSPEAMI